MLRFVLSTSLLHAAAGECTNACSGHGDCTAFEMCNCWRNWMGNDCSQRICGFDIAYVDTPKGDLNHNGEVDLPDDMLIENSHMYPYGTTEMWPRLTTSDHAILAETGHAYMECSNNGYCNRKTGECECLEGFEGSTCQRTTCPGYPYVECSGNGVCRSKRQIASLDNENIYELWDKHITRGCVCDKPFFGPDCSERMCPLGVDPMYLDDTATIRWQTFDLALLTTAPTKDWSDGASGGYSTGTAYWKIIFYGRDGQKFLTDPLPAGATCDQVVDALNNLPTKPVKLTYSQCVQTSSINDDPLSGDSNWTNTDFMDSTRKYDYSKMAFWSYDSEGNVDTERSSVDSSSLALSGDIYRIHLIDTPGVFPEPEVSYVDMDGSGDQLVSSGDIYTRVWSDGQNGENTDYFADHCDDVTVTLAYDEEEGYTYFTGLDSTERKLLEQCLGGSDFDDDNNIGISNWDYGSESYPHMIKLVLTVTHTKDLGYWVPLVYNATDDRFKLISPWKRLNTNSGLVDTGEQDNFEIYTTQSVFSRSSTRAEVTFDFASHTMITSNVTHEFVESVEYTGDMSCEVVNGDDFHLTTMKNVSGQEHCLAKGDKFVVLTTDDWMVNPANLNIYTVEKIYTKKGFSRENQFSGALPRHPNHYGTHIIKTDVATNFAHSVSRPERFFIYKMFENVKSSYTYVSQCSNRGICNTDEGVCECFGGYTGNACETVSELAV